MSRNGDQKMGEIVKICLPLEKGKIIAASPDGTLTCDIPSGEAKDEQWRFIQVKVPFIPGIPHTEPGFNIVSINYKLVMDYDPATGEQIAVVPYNEIDRTKTIWHISEDNEIYTYDNEGNKKYLWSAMGNIYVTHDEHLAENWQAVSMEGFEIPMTDKNFSKKEKWSAWLLVFIVVFLIYLFYSRIRK